MYSALIGIHVFAMIASLVLMPVAIFLALRGIRFSMKLATAAIMVTEIGFFAGVVLLFSAPMLSECIILTTYLVAMIAVYALGFGWGAEAKARLIKKAV